MSYNRKVGFEYYHVICNKNDSEVKFDLRRWMSEINELSLESRARDYYQEEARLDDASFDDVNNYYFLQFVRLRETNIPNKAKVNSQSEPIELEDDEYIGEGVTALYDPSNNVIMLQRNRYSLSPTGIEKYLNLTWAGDEKIYLRPIINENIIEKIKKAEYYRKLKVRFADLPENSYKGSKFSAIKSIVNQIGKFDAVNAEVTITLGYERGISLNKEAVNDTITELTNNEDLIKKAEISKKDTDDTRVETLDLFEHKLHDYIYIALESKQSLNYFILKPEMIVTYNDRKSEVNKCLEG